MRHRWVLLLIVAATLSGQGRRQRTPAPDAPAEQPPAANAQPGTPGQPVPQQAAPAVLPSPPAGTPVSPGGTKGGGPGGAGEFGAPPAVEKTSRTQHALEIGGVRIPYTATAGTLVLRREDGRALATVFYVAYTRDDTPDKSRRPITFAFNGGPGSSSVWLHMGALGPKRVPLGPEGIQPSPPYRLVDNDDSSLPFTDLVFIDPVSTGFSRQAPGENPQQFHGFDGDLESVAEFIRLYTTRSERWASPKFLAGESYGTTRAAALSQYLLEHHGIYLNGIVLVSSILNFETADFSPGNDLPYILFLPTYTAAAWYHKKLPADLQADLKGAIEESKRFASNEYTLALMKGDRISDTERSDISKQLARLTGLSREFIDLSNLRVSIFRFDKELLRAERRTLGRFDSRLEGIDRDAAGDAPDYDPSYSSVLGAYTNMFNEYLRTQLKYESDLPYEILTNKVRPWSYGRFENRYVNVAELLRQAITQNPNLKVMIANGYYDLATPFFATEYTVNHLSLDRSLRGNVSLTYCDAGHMLYTKKSCLDALHSSMADFYKQALGSAGVSAPSAQ